MTAIPPSGWLPPGRPVKKHAAGLSVCWKHADERNQRSKEIHEIKKPMKLENHEIEKALYGQQLNLPAIEGFFFYNPVKI